MRMKFVLLLDGRLNFTVEPDGIKVDANLVTAGKPDQILLIDAQDELALIRFVREHLKDIEVKILPVVNYENYFNTGGSYAGYNEF